MAEYVFTYETAIGTVIIAANETGITRLMIGEGVPLPNGMVVTETPVIEQAALQLTEYLSGTRTTFDILLSPGGTPFTQSVWRELVNIPYGQTGTYGHIAQAIGNAKASRAVGLANNRNPIAIMIPCHRVIGANGSLTGYRWGLGIKERLLRLEQGLKD